METSKAFLIWQGFFAECIEVLGLFFFLNIKMLQYALCTQGQKFKNIFKRSSERTISTRQLLMSVSFLLTDFFCCFIDLQREEYQTNLYFCH